MWMLTKLNAFFFSRLKLIYSLFWDKTILSFILSFFYFSFNKGHIGQPKTFRPPPTVGSPCIWADTRESVHVRPCSSLTVRFFLSVLVKNALLCDRVKNSSLSLCAGAIDGQIFALNGGDKSSSGPWMERSGLNRPCVIPAYSSSNGSPVLRDRLQVCLPQTKKKKCGFRSAWGPSPRTATADCRSSFHLYFCSATKGNGIGWSEAK